LLTHDIIRSGGFQSGVTQTICASSQFLRDYAPLLAGESCHSWSGTIPSRRGRQERTCDGFYITCTDPASTICQEQIVRGEVRFTNMFYRAHSMCGMGLVTGTDSTCNAFYRPDEWPRAYVYHIFF
jgi:hypothetical protein